MPKIGTHDYQEAHLQGNILKAPKIQCPQQLFAVLERVHNGISQASSMVIQAANAVMLIYLLDTRPPSSHYPHTTKESYFAVTWCEARTLEMVDNP
jgi:hypothetical protein